jgi:uncharacterized membrane protein YGL010W
MHQIDILLTEYGESHQNSTNKLIHWICVPIIFWSIVALLWTVKLDVEIPSTTYHLNLALVALVAVIYYYIKLSIRLTIGMLIFSFACIAITDRLEENLQTLNFPLWGFALILFVIAWILQFVGHNIEGKKPSFLKDLQFLMIGPAWLMHFIFKKIGVKY